jgi:hypothetical protein
MFLIITNTKTTAIETLLVYLEIIIEGNLGK